MANIELQGNQYLNVPYVDLPTTDQSTARFWEDVLKMGTMRNDAELVQTWSNDYMYVSSGGTLPAYSTSATTIKAAENLTPTASFTWNTYNYYVLIRGLTIPVYNTSTIVASRNEYALVSGMYEIVEFPGSTFKSLDGSKTFTSRSSNTVSAGGAYRMVYWSSASAIGVYTSSSYGVQQVLSAPSFSSSTFTAKSPTLQMRGGNTYLTQAVYESITDIRVQYIIELYRAKKGNLNLNGWGMFTQGLHIVDCVNSANHNLT